MSFCGILIMLVPFFTTYEWLVTFAVLLGFTDCIITILFEYEIRIIAENYFHCFYSMFLRPSTYSTRRADRNGERQQRIRFQFLVLWIS